MSVYVVKNWQSKAARAYTTEQWARDMASFLAIGLGGGFIDVYEFSEQGWDEELVHLIENEWEVQDYTLEVPKWYKYGSWSKIGEY